MTGAQPLAFGGEFWQLAFAVEPNDLLAANVASPLHPTEGTLGVQPFLCFI